jgi:hypothetical protein
MKGSHLAVFEGVELNLLCLKINLGARRHSFSELFFLFGRF